MLQAFDTGPVVCGRLCWAVVAGESCSFRFAYEYRTRRAAGNLPRSGRPSGLSSTTTVYPLNPFGISGIHGRYAELGRWAGLCSAGQLLELKVAQPVEMAQVRQFELLPPAPLSPHPILFGKERRPSLEVLSSSLIIALTQLLVHFPRLVRILKPSRLQECLTSIS